jgi:beta-glucosidase
MEDPIIKDEATLQFPEGFLWGAATSHFQVEGHPVEMKSRLSDWSTWATTAGNIADSTTADAACDFVSRYLDDIELLSGLNLGALRISVNWAVLCPTDRSGQGRKRLNQEGVRYYKKLLSTLKERGIKTFVTLFHFCLPQWLAEEGGWLSPRTAQEFGRFAELVATELGEYVDYWITINEPLPYAYQGYVDGSWPPGQKHHYVNAFRCVHNMLQGHALAYHAIHKVIPDAQVGFTNHWRPFVPVNRWNPLDKLVTHMRNRVFNHMFPNAIKTGRMHFPFPLTMRKAIAELCVPIEGLKGTMDYSGVNYYTRDLSHHSFEAPFDVFGRSSRCPDSEISCMGWESYPDGLYDILTQEMTQYTMVEGKECPIIITENGFADLFPAHLVEGDWSLADDYRIRYLISHLKAMHKAIKKGANVKGYLYWSLLDNFEWAEGLKARFGLVRVAFPTQERTLRKSAYVYAKIASSNALDNRQAY